MKKRTHCSICNREFGVTCTCPDEDRVQDICHEDMLMIECGRLRRLEAVVRKSMESRSKPPAAIMDALADLDALKRKGVAK